MPHTPSICWNSVVTIVVIMIIIIVLMIFSNITISGDQDWSTHVWCLEEDGLLLEWQSSHTPGIAIPVFCQQLFDTPAGCDWSPACLAFLAGAAAAGASLPPPFDGVPLTTLLELGEDCMVSDNSLTMPMQF